MIHMNFTKDLFHLLPNGFNKKKFNITIFLYFKNVTLIYTNKCGGYSFNQ